MLDILRRRSDGFHELETLMHPVPLFDELQFERGQGAEVRLTCSDPRLAVDSRNLVHRAATAFLSAAGSNEGVKIHLEKRIPMEAGLGGGSSDAAHTLLGLDELFGHPLNPERMSSLAAELGSDVTVFLRDKPALAQGRGERVEWLEPFSIFDHSGLLIVHPGFGVATPWAYQNLARFPQGFSGNPGRTQRLIETLRAGDLAAAVAQFYNALELPVLAKYPLLRVIQEFLCSEGALVARMSGSGSATFALTANVDEARRLEERVSAAFGTECWVRSLEFQG